MLCIGIMSGTSLDGVDAALVNIDEKKANKYELLHFTCLPFEKEYKERVLNIASNKNTNIQRICNLNVEISEYYKKAVYKLLDEAKVKIEDIKFIAMHGQTCWHNPHHMDGYFSSTLQLGEPSVLAAEFNCKVISNFRSMDVALGGSGAPLVPFANYELYHSDKINIAMQNIGGIGNVTYLKKGGTLDDIIAFDTGPGNMLIDMAMRRLYNKAYDECGNIALTGNVNKKVIDVLLKDDYLFAPLPKSTGREKYNDEYLDNIFKMMEGSKKEDIIATITSYTAETIAISYKNFLEGVDKVIVSGGGAYNKFLLKELKRLLSCDIEIENNADSLEALSFAILGYHTLNHLPSNVISVTGASRYAVLGSITDPIIKRK